MAIDLFNYSRRRTTEVRIGGTPLGGNNPIRVQSMTTTDTNDTAASIAQARRIIDRGGEYVRLTTQGVREAENLKNIRNGLTAEGYSAPLVADVHFNARVSEVAALYAGKVRVNPGNYVDPARTFKHLEYTDEEYAAELQRIEERFVPFLNICKQNNTAVRIGVNHGSLSDRIMSRYGDTPEGIVESCMEFLRICRKEAFSNVVISIKASNTVVMVQSVRLLVKTMDDEGMAYALHLGVTEAGEGEDGRIKSAVGIGALLADGIGDTIRVSLSEDPEDEIPVARHLVDYVTRSRAAEQRIEQLAAPQFNWLRPARRSTIAVLPQGTESTATSTKGTATSTTVAAIGGDNVPVVIGIGGDYESLEQMLQAVGENNVVVSRGTFAQHRALAHRLMTEGDTRPLIVCYDYHHNNKEAFQLEAAADMGALLIDGLVDGICLTNTEGDMPATDNSDATPTTSGITAEDITATAFGILQAARQRMTKTEYISCPGCGRTLYDLRSTIAKIKAATAHLTGLKIGIMGCIVNGPGEMADADYGYVGAGRGKISLYRKQVCVEKNIPEEQAVGKLLQLINSDAATINETER